MFFEAVTLQLAATLSAAIQSNGSTVQQARNVTKNTKYVLAESFQSLERKKGLICLLLRAFFDWCPVASLDKMAARRAAARLSSQKTPLTH